MPTPFFDLIQELRSLGGAPKVTFPYGDPAYPQTERVIKARRGNHILGWGTPEPDAARFPNSKLTDESELTSDAQVVEVYRKYEVLPGKWVTTTMVDDDSMISVVSRRRNLAANIVSGEGVSDVTGVWTRTTMENSNSRVADEVVETRTVPGTTIVEYEQDPQYLFDIETATTKVNAADVTAPSAVAGQTTAFKAVDADVSEKIVMSVPTAALDAFSLTFPATTSIDLPRVLESISVIWDVTTAAGSYSESGSGAAVGSSASLAISANGRGQGSASVTPELIPVFNSIWTDDLPVIDYFFFLPNPVTLSAVLAKVSTLAGAAVSAWPVFKPKSHTFVLIGQKVSLSAEATARCAVSLNASDVSETQSQGHGLNYDFGSTVRSVTIPECIHAALSLTGGTTNTSAATATADATVLPGSNFPGAHDSSSAGASAAGLVTPASLGATAPPGLPASGLYLKSSDVALFKWGYSNVRCRVFDFSILA